MPRVILPSSVDVAVSIYGCFHGKLDRKYLWKRRLLFGKEELKHAEGNSSCCSEYLWFVYMAMQFGQRFRGLIPYKDRPERFKS